MVSATGRGSAAWRAFPRALGQVRSALQLSITARLAISFTAVVVLVIAANLLVVSQVAVIRTTVFRPVAAQVTVPAIPAAPLPVPELPAPLVQSAPHVPAASESGLPSAIADFEMAVRERTQSNSEDALREYRRAALQLDHAATDFSRAAHKAGAADTGRLSAAVRDWEQCAAELVGLGDSRRDFLQAYTVRFEQLSARSKHSLDQAWKIFGRVVARQSLVKLTGNLDELRRHYAEFIATEEADTATLEVLTGAEAAVGQVLTDDRVGFTRVNGEQWYAASVADLSAMSAARISLQRLEEQRRLSAQSFADAATRLRQSIARIIAGTPNLQLAAGMVPPLPSRTPAAAVNGERSAAVPLDPEHSASAVAGQPPQRSASTTVDSPADRSRNQLVGWISFGVLLLVIYISVGTVISIVKPVRRLIRATASLARGEPRVRVERGGVRELDALARAFNDMAAQLHAAQQAARGQQQLLEAKVTERTQQLQALAERDPLTRLANRRHFFALLETALEAATRTRMHVGVLFIDIDNFKNMNDSLGHAFGDQVLVAIARKLDRAVQSFGFAARLGGDEFTVVYESAASVEQIRAAGETLVHVFDEPLSFDGREVTVSISIGASVFPLHAQDAAALLRAADAALFQAKALGRSCLALFTPELLDAARIRFTTEQGLRRAMERGEFELLFQPEVDLATGRTELVEALLRWRLPDGRLAPPGEFLAVAEESGLITQINDWVLRTAVQTAADWYHGVWPGARVAINISPRQLLDSRFVDNVQALLAKLDLPPRCLEIELTETVLQTGRSTIEALRRLRAHGLAIALDDFGSGFSSLASLEQLPLTRIKLDRSLVASIDSSPRSAAIARAIITLCQSLGLLVTAEGIERPEQLAHLAGYPALHGQGYLIARAVSRDALMAVLAGIPSAIAALLRSNLTAMAEEEIAARLPLLTASFKR